MSRALFEYREIDGGDTWVWDEETQKAMSEEEWFVACRIVLLQIERDEARAALKAAQRQMTE